MRLVFMGSPQFALPSLKALSEHFNVATVVCQPDRRAGRGRVPSSPATKIFAIEAGIPVIQPEQIGHPEVLESIAAIEPDLLVVAAYGQILPQALLDLPRHGSLNVHASLLPRWRGAAPVQAAIQSGDRETGVTIMRMDAGLDTGPILSQRSIKLTLDETGGSLTERLSHIGADLLIETVPGYLAGEIQAQPQDDSQSTYAPLLKKSDGALDFGSTAEELERQIRAFDPWPGSYLIWAGKRLAVKQAHATSDNGAKASEVYLLDGIPAIPTQKGTLVLDLVQPAGKHEMPGEAFVRGAPDFVGANLARDP